jgi:peptide/nickel transport system substrate-binding protein
MSFKYKRRDIMKKILLFTVVLLFSATLFCFSAGSRDNDAGAETLRIGWHVDEGTLNPYTYVSGPGLHVVNLIYDCLFQIDSDNIPQPWLVSDYTISEDQLTYTLNLHKNVKWHDGTPFTSADVKFTYEYIMKYNKSRFTKPSKAIKSVETMGDHTVVFTIDKPRVNFFIQPLADLPILPKHIWEKIEDPDSSAETVGTGPYLLTEIKLGQLYRLQANKEYFKGTPKVAEIVIPIIKDNTAMFTAIRAGELDMAGKELAPELITDFENDKNLKVIKGAGFGTTQLQFNAENEHLSKTEFRQALVYATDMKDIISTVMLNSATAGSMGFIHPSSAYYNSSVNKYSQNFNKANKILEDLGYSDTDNDSVRETPEGEDLAFELLVYSNNPIRIRIAELLREWYGKIGVKITLKSMDMDTVDSLVWPGFDVTQGRDYDMSMWGWSASMQIFPGRLVELLHSNPDMGYLNIGAFKSSEFDSLGDKLAVTYETAKRKELLSKMQKIVSEECPIIPLYYQDYAFAYNADAYDEWVFIKGLGIFNKLSFLD